MELRIAKDLGDKIEEGRALGFLGDCYRTTREFKLSMNFHKLANEIFRQAGNRVLQGRAEGCLGVAHAQRYR